MNDDVKVLREAADQFEKVSNAQRKDFGDPYYKVMILLCRDLADRIEREGAKIVKPTIKQLEEILDNPNAGRVVLQSDGSIRVEPAALSEAEDRGWNACMMQAKQVIQAYKDRMDTAILTRNASNQSSAIPECKSDAAQTLLEAVSALRRGAS